MDGFDLVTNGETMEGFSSFTRKGLPNYWAYADNFVLSDHTFSSMYGPTFPNHLYTVTAQDAWSARTRPFESVVTAPTSPRPSIDSRR